MKFMMTLIALALTATTVQANPRHGGGPDYGRDYDRGGPSDYDRDYDRGGRDRDRDRGRGPSRGDVTLNNVTDQWGTPFIALTAPDDAILKGHRSPYADARSTMEAVRIRAQQLCTYNRLGQLIDYGFGRENERRYVQINYGWTVSEVSWELVRPFRDGRIVGYAKGFSYIRCTAR